MPLMFVNFGVKFNVFNTRKIENLHQTEYLPLWKWHLFFLGGLKILKSRDIPQEGLEFFALCYANLTRQPENCALRIDF